MSGAGKMVILLFLYKMKHYCKLLYYFVVCCLCLLKGNWLFVFEHCNFYLRNCAFIGGVIPLFVVNDILHLLFFFLSIAILLRCTVTDVVTGNLSFAPRLFWLVQNKHYF